MIRYFALFLLSWPWLSLADTLSTKRPDSHAPISIMGDHLHHQGEWMVSFRSMQMTMNKNLSGTKEVSNPEIFDLGYHMAPDEMTMIMHMLGLMFAPSDDITLMLMIPWIENDMSMTMQGMQMQMANTLNMNDGMSMEDDMNMLHGNENMQHNGSSHMDMNSEGLGDIKLTALVSLWQQEYARLHLNLGFSLPTGSIDKKNGESVLPYAMQLGSGTYDILPGITWNHAFSTFSYGVQISGVLRTGNNDRGYRLGNQLHLKTWIAKPWLRWLSNSVSLGYAHTANISGKDDALLSASPVADPELRGGRQWLAGLGTNILLPHGNRLAIEYQLPVHQDLNGPQPALSQSLTAGWQWAF